MGVVENLDVYLADWGRPVTFTGAPAGTVGIVDVRDLHALPAGGFTPSATIGRERTVLLKSSVASLLTVGMAITVDGVNRLVRDPAAEKDGSFTLVALRDAT